MGRTLKFSELLLISSREKTALKVPFGSDPTIIQAPNGSGKSAVLKSLYETLGATPHKIDPSWQQAQVASLLKFTVDGVPFAAIKAFDLFAIFDGNDRMLIRTGSKSRDLASFYRDLFGFKLVMTGRSEETVTPPPSYVFAPYYIDQDAGWAKPWTSFKDLYLSRSPPTLADYHSGIKPDQFYEAQARRDLIAMETRHLEAIRDTIAETLKEFRSIADDNIIDYDIAQFATEAASLVESSQFLLERQQQYRNELFVSSEELHLWQEQRGILTAAILEMDQDFASSLSAPPEVECPTCGQHYDNSLVSRFRIIGDKDTLLFALANAQTNFDACARRTDDVRTSLAAVEAALDRVRVVLDKSKEDLTFRDIVAAEGRNEAIRLIRERLAGADAAVSEAQRRVDAASAEMKESSTPAKAREIRQTFNETMYKFCATLDVRIQNRRLTPIYVAGRARGSEGTRELLAYYFAFIHTMKNFGTAVSCPIVIDAPNQQGQDAVHLPTVLNFIMDQYPKGSQLIVAVEDGEPISGRGNLVKLGIAERQVLDASQYEDVSAQMKPYLAALVGAGDGELI